MPRLRSDSRDDVAVLTLVKGRAAHLHAQIAGIARGTRWPDQFVVVEMGPSPPDLPSLPFPVTVHHMPSVGLPLAAARNAAARIAGAATMIFLDVDCIPAGNLVEALAGDARRADALICCEVRYLPATVRNADESVMLSQGKRHPIRPFPATGMRQEANAGLFWSLAFAMRRESFGRIGGFDEAFTGYGAEDTDFAFRAREAGLPLLFTGSTLAFHQHHPIHDPPLQHFDDIVRNADLFRLRHGIWPMQGWLSDFARLGLIAPPLPTGPLTILRRPTQAEFAATLCPQDRAY